MGVTSVYYVSEWRVRLSCKMMAGADLTECGYGKKKTSVAFLNLFKLKRFKILT